MKNYNETNNLIVTSNDANYGNLEEIANNENPTSFVFRDGALVPADQVNTQTDNYITTSEDPNFSNLDDIARSENPTAYVFRNGELVPETQVDTSSENYIKTSEDPNFAGYWFEEDSLFRFEQQCMENAKKGFGKNHFKYNFKYDKALKKMTADVELDAKFEPDQPSVRYNFFIIFENNHPGRGSDGMFGGTIKIIPVARNGVRLKDKDFMYGTKAFEHLIRHNAYGIPYICQLKHADSSKVNCYHAMQNVTRWIQVYEVFRKTGKDIDAGKAA